MPVKRSFLIVIASLVGILFSTMPNVDAQSANCFGLAAADCKIVAAADANLFQATSFQYDFDLQGKFKLGPEIGSGNVTAKGSGIFEADVARIGTLNPGNMAGMADALKMTFGVDGALTNKTSAGATSQKGKISLILLHGVLYYKDTQNDQWVGVNILNEMLNSANLSLSGASGDPTTQALLNDPSVVRAVAAMPSIKGFIKVKKTGNTPVLEGQRQIEFVYAFDIPTLLASKEFRPIFRLLLKSYGVSTDDYTDAQWVGFARGFWVAFNGTTVKVTRWIGSKDHLYHALMIDLTFRFNPRAVGAPEVPPMSADFHFGVRLTKIGQEFTVTPPADVFMVSTPTPTSPPTKQPTRTPVPSDTPATTATALPSHTAIPTTMSTSIPMVSATPTQTAKSIGTPDAEFTATVSLNGTAAR